MQWTFAHKRGAADVIWILDTRAAGDTIRPT